MSASSDRIRAIIGPHLGTLALLAALSLSAIGIAGIRTASQFDATNWAQKQAVWLLVSVGVMVLCALPHPRIIGAVSFPLFVLTLGLLAFLLVPGVPRWLVEPRNGARCWINLHFMAFQPGEVARIAYILALARYLRFKENYRTLTGLLLPFAITFIPVGLIFVEPDLGMTLLFGPTLFAVLVAAGAKMRHMLTLVGLGLIVVGLVIAMVYLQPRMANFLLREYRVNRIKSMISLAQGDTPFARTTAYQQAKAMTLLGAGRATGYGVQRSATIVRYNALPEAHNDMIFPVVVNRWGLAGGMAVLALYAVFIGSFIVAAARSKDPFMRLAMVGFAAMIFTQTTINIGMTLGLLPITGLTLPFISYGGSSLLSSFAMLGLLINFASRRPAIIARPSFEYGGADAVMQ